MQLAQLAEQLAAERERVPAPVFVSADGELCPVGATQQQALDGLGGDPRLIPEHQHEHLRALVDDAERGRDRRRAPLSEVAVLDRLGPR